MADRILKLKELRRILKRYGVWEDASRGKGSHTSFLRRIGDAVFFYPIPTSDHDVQVCYVRGVRKRLKLTEADGVTDEEFYSS